MTLLSASAEIAAALLYWTGNAPRGSIALLIGLLAAQGFFLNGVQVTGYTLVAHVASSGSSVSSNSVSASSTWITTSAGRRPPPPFIERIPA